MSLTRLEQWIDVPVLDRSSEAGSSEAVSHAPEMITYARRYVAFCGSEPSVSCRVFRVYRGTLLGSDPDLGISEAAAERTMKWISLSSAW